MTQPIREPFNLLGFTSTELISYVENSGFSPSWGQKLLQWIHQRGITDLTQIPNLNQGLLRQLHSQTVISVPTLSSEQIAKDGTRKWLVRLTDGNFVETVFIPEPGRGTLCVSSQVGCALNCSFCATGKEGFNRNLTTAEIIGQLWLAVRQLTPKGLVQSHPITNVVMMGMGEPLLNYSNVVKAMSLMLDDFAYGLSKYRVTISTAGVIPALCELKKESPVSLAISLHAPNNALRNELVPLNKKYPLEMLLPICQEYFPNRSKRLILFEYVMLSGINDSLDMAEQLAELLRNIPCKVNLIPFNPYFKARYQCSDKATIIAFQKRLIQLGISTWLRKTRGAEIEGACGQLAGKIIDRTGRNLRWQKTNRLVPDKAARNF